MLIRIRIEVNIWIRIFICMETNADPQRFFIQNSEEKKILCRENLQSSYFSRLGNLNIVFVFWMYGIVLFPMISCITSILPKLIDIATFASKTRWEIYLNFLGNWFLYLFISYRYIKWVGTVRRYPIACFGYGILL